MEKKTIVPLVFLRNGESIYSPFLSQPYPPKNRLHLIFKVNEQKGYAKETMILENNYTLEITSKGCNTRWITYSFSLPVEDLDIKNTIAVSQKVIELIKMTSQFSQSPIDLESKIEPLKMAVDQIGPFSIGEEFILKDGKIKEAFVLEQLKEKDGKILLVYYFTKELD